MERQCFIITGGEYCPLPQEWERQIKEQNQTPNSTVSKDTLVIACDRGWKHAKKMHVIPDVIIGDFDSSEKPDHPNILTFPIRKDDTDTMLAIKYAIKKGYQRITTLCAFGGRLDHTMANLQSAAYIVHQGGEAILWGNDTRVLAFSNQTKTFPREDGWTLSIFSLSDSCNGVEIKGAKYDAKDITLDSHFPLGVSNGWIADEVEITVRNGILAVMECKEV